MKFCEKCGKQIHDEAVICVGCGCEIKPEIAGQQQMPYEKIIKDSAIIAKTSIITNIVCSVILVITIFLWINDIIDLPFIGVLLLASECIAMFPLMRVNSVLERNGLEKNDKSKRRAIMKLLRKHFPGLLIATIMMFICFALLIFCCIVII